MKLPGLFKILSRLRALESATAPCARCGAVMDITATRASGPRIVETVNKGQTVRAVTCSWCANALKPQGWKPMKTGATK